MSDTAQNKLIVRRFFEELWNERKLDAADEIFSDECVTHQLQSGAADEGVLRDAAMMKEHIKGWLAAFPDLRWTGENISIRMIVIHRIAKDKIVEDWVVIESYGFFQQLGLVPPVDKLAGS